MKSTSRVETAQLGMVEHRTRHNRFYGGNILRRIAPPTPEGCLGSCLFDYRVLLARTCVPLRSVKAKGTSLSGELRISGTSLQQATHRTMHMGGSPGSVRPLDGWQNWQKNEDATQDPTEITGAKQPLDVGNTIIAWGTKVSREGSWGQCVPEFRSVMPALPSPYGLNLLPGLSKRIPRTHRHFLIGARRF